MLRNVDDSLLAFHAFASHMPQGLSWVVSSYADSEPWKLRYKGGADSDEKGKTHQELTGPELCLYNAEDIRLTKLAWDRLQPDLEAERKIYEHDIELAKVCHEMIWEGLGVDEDRRRELSVKCGKRRAALKGRMRHELGKSDFAPGKLDEVRDALFGDLGGRVIRYTSAGKQSTNNETLEALAGDDSKLSRFAKQLLAWRIVGKIKSTYLDAVLVNPSTGRAHYTFKAYGTVSGRLSSRIQSCPRYSNDLPENRVREIYVPRRGNRFVYFDVSQAEMRLAAYISGDAQFVKSCEGDIHANNAKLVFPEQAALGWFDGDAKKDPKRGKPYRDICKNFGFAICYGAEADKLFLTLRRKGFPITMAQCEMILAKLRSSYRTYYKFVSNNVDLVRQVGFMRSPIMGRIRWLSWAPKPTDVSNYPIQSCLADLMNLRMIELHARLMRGMRSRIVLQIHDSIIVDAPIEECAIIESWIKELWEEPIPLAGGNLILPIDLKRGDRLSDL